MTREGRPESGAQAHGHGEGVKIGPRAATGAAIGMPVRVQLRRTKGWRKPEGAIIVDRRTRYGNPFTGDGDRALAVERFREWITDPRLIVVRGPDGYDWYNHGVMGPHIPNLRGHDLACWCPLDQPCHADVLLGIANPRPL